MLINFRKSVVLRPKLTFPSCKENEVRGGEYWKRNYSKTFRNTYFEWTKNYSSPSSKTLFSFPTESISMVSASFNPINSLFPFLYIHTMHYMSLRYKFCS